MIFDTSLECPHASKTGRCIDDTTLKQISSSLGDDIPSDGVKTSAGRSVKTSTIGVSSKHADIMESIKEAFSCDDEECIIRIAYKKKYISKKIFHTLMSKVKPEGPTDKTTWLSNVNIDNVLKQATHKYPTFLHIDFQMRDFINDRNNKLANLDFYEHYQKGKRTFGVALNTDYSTGSGLHWFAIFGDFRKKPYTIEYFNSTAEDPLDEVALWLRTARQLWEASFNENIDVVYVTKYAHQKDNNSCGVYTLYYILSRLEGESYTYFMENKLTDNLMYEFRKYLFKDPN